MAPIALLVARIWRDARTGSRVAAIVLLIAGVALFVAPFVVHLPAEYGDAAKVSPIAIGATWIIGGALALMPRPDAALVALTIPMIAIPLTANPIMPAVGAP